MDSHSHAVEEIAGVIRCFHDSKTPFRIYHGSTTSTRERRSNSSNVVDISCLDHVLSIDQDRKTALVEANVLMDALVQHTLAHHLFPRVVMEFRGITVGGGSSSTSGESSSFKLGFFDRTVNLIEILLGNGKRVNASHTERSDLFWSAASRVGTMSVVTLLEIQLRDVEPNSRLELRYLFADRWKRHLRQYKELYPTRTRSTSMGSYSASMKLSFARVASNRIILVPTQSLSNDLHVGKMNGSMSTDRIGCRERNRLRRSLSTTSH